MFIYVYIFILEYFVQHFSNQQTNNDVKRKFIVLLKKMNFLTIGSLKWLIEYKSVTKIFLCVGFLLTTDSVLSSEGAYRDFAHLLHPLGCHIHLPPLITYKGLWLFHRMECPTLVWFNFLSTIINFSFIHITETACLVVQFWQVIQHDWSITTPHSRTTWYSVRVPAFYQDIQVFLWCARQKYSKMRSTHKTFNVVQQFT